MLEGKTATMIVPQKSQIVECTVACGWWCFSCARCFETWCVLRCGTRRGFRQRACLAPEGSWRDWRGSFNGGLPAKVLRQGHAFHWLRPLRTSAVNRPRAPRSPPPLRCRGTPHFLNGWFPSIQSICVSSSPRRECWQLLPLKTPRKASTLCRKLLKVWTQFSLLFCQS